MRRADAHPLLRILDEAAEGRFPPADGAVDVLPPAPGTCDVVMAFTAHGVASLPIATEELINMLPSGDVFSLLDARVLDRLGDRLSSEPGSLDVVLAATGTADLPGEPLVPSDRRDHPRVRRAGRYRPNLDVLEPPGGGGVLVIGHGVAGRLEVAVEVDLERRGTGLGRRMLATARELAGGKPLYGQVAPGNASSLRTFLAAGFVPLGAEVLFPRDTSATQTRAMRQS